MYFFVRFTVVYEKRRGQTGFQWVLKAVWGRKYYFGIYIVCKNETV